MEPRSPLVFKVASEDWEMDLIHQLNYKTFAEEIPQHEANPNKRLVDRFHAENTYIICLSGRKLAGMLALRAKRPFSLDQKLPNLDSYLPSGRNICELRLLAVDHKYRTGQVFQGFMAMIWQYFVEHGLDLAIISGTTRQRKLYHHLGFIPFGPLVGNEGAHFQPMYHSIESFEAGARNFLSTRSSNNFDRTMVNLLPGPVAISRAVRRAFELAPESHRSESFVEDLQTAKQLLCGLAGAASVEILLGSGTLANDVIAGQLSLDQKPGIVLASGEFGERLVDHARRFALKFDVIKADCGSTFDFNAIARSLEKSRPAWLWCAHCETSTGILQNIDRLKSLCASHNVKLCLDCISSIGTVPVDLGGVYLASCASGKGLQSFPGLCMVFYNHELPDAGGRLPRYLDLGLYARQQGVAFTHSSNLVQALQTAVKRLDCPSRFELLREISAWLRPKLREMGFNLIGSDADTSPAVMTLALPAELDSTQIGAQLHEAGFLLSYNSEYLRRKNWIQICLMGEIAREKLVSLLNHLNRVCFRRKQSAAHEESSDATRTR